MKIQTNCKCVVNETHFSVTMLLSRLLITAAQLYFITGVILNFRTISQNAVNIFHFPVTPAIVIAVCLIGIAITLALLLGLRTRTAALCLLIFNMILGIVFTLGTVNRLSLFFVTLSIAALLTPLLLGGGKYSMDFIKARKATTEYLSK
ncbi:hypothetical protein Emin_1467 [Elusimicrobium minutum Pei191]|uniref:DoxX family protein n=1 Tax=Elusimicrobium minutum (strain Pei191) TaxID=445932 RepID=B2KER9_ELUMP|nr:hypothetical protein [Elusimicrobium minutum]ACC99015.1 hypothetical protein Emin_1467 [Elusimicrobium minutum Pei191]